MWRVAWEVEDAGPSHAPRPRHRLERAGPARDGPLEPQRLSLERVRPGHLRSPGGRMIPRRHLWTSALAGIALLAAFRPLPAGPVEDDEERQERLAVSERAMQENCLICHSEEMVTTARLTAKQWKAEVEKMVGWGSPLPKEQQGPLIEYLAGQYPDTAPPAPLRTMTLADAEATIRPLPQADPRPHGDPSRGAPLYASQCANCHGPDGPRRRARAEPRRHPQAAPPGGIQRIRPPRPPPHARLRRRAEARAGGRHPRLAPPAAVSGRGREVTQAGSAQPTRNRSRASSEAPRMPASSPSAASSILILW